MLVQLGGLCNGPSHPHMMDERTITRPSIAIERLGERANERKKGKVADMGRLQLRRRVGGCVHK